MTKVVRTAGDLTKNEGQEPHSYSSASMGGGRDPHRFAFWW